MQQCLMVPSCIIAPRVEADSLCANLCSCFCNNRTAHGSCVCAGIHHVQAGNLLKPEMLLSMARDPVVFACANPNPEIDPETGMYKNILESRMLHSFAP